MTIQSNVERERGYAEKFLTDVFCDLEDLVYFMTFTWCLHNHFFLAALCLALSYTSSDWWEAACPSLIGGQCSHARKN